MLRRFNSLLFTVMAVMFFVGAAMPTIVREFSDFRDHQNRMGPLITEVEGVIPTEDLSIISGEQVIGMVPFAINGEYVLIVDGVQIIEGMDLDYVSFSGVVGLDYKLEVITNPSTSVTTVIANAIL